MAVKQSLSQSQPGVLQNESSVVVGVIPGEVDEVVEGEEARRRLFKVFPGKRHVGKSELLRPVLSAADRDSTSAVYIGKEKNERQDQGKKVRIGSRRRGKAKIQRKNFCKWKGREREKYNRKRETENEMQKERERMAE